MNIVKIPFERDTGVFTAAVGEAIQSMRRIWRTSIYRIWAVRESAWTEQSFIFSLSRFHFAFEN